MLFCKIRYFWAKGWEFQVKGIILEFNKEKQLKPIKDLTK